MATYFIQKWIQSVDVTLKEHQTEFKEISKQLLELKLTQSPLVETISTVVKTHLKDYKLPFSKLDKIEEDVVLTKKVLSEKILPQLESQEENLGRVLIIETQLREQDAKMVTLFNILKLVVSQKKNDQK